MISTADGAELTKESTRLAAAFNEQTFAQLRCAGRTRLM
jgi:hypothetical protein